MSRNRAPLTLVVAINVVSAAGWFFTASPEEAAWLGGLVPATMRTLDGEWWRLLVAPFLHVRLEHLLLNAFTLLWTGLVAARLLGERVMVTIWLLGGLLGSLASLGFTATWALGASGANAALVGALLGLAARWWRKLTSNERRLLALGVAPGLLALLLFGLTAQTDHAAHAGGLLSGFLLGVFLPWLPQRSGFVVMGATTII